MSDFEDSASVSEAEYISSDGSEEFTETPAAVKKKSPPKPLQDATNISNAPAKKKSNASEQYQKLSQLEHILKRPDTYIGSVEKTPTKMWSFDSVLESMKYEEVTIVPGLYKIFDEILVNAADNKIRDPSMKNIKVKIDPENNLISVMNDGKGIPVEIHEKEKIYIPELIFGNLLTSSNYDDDEKKVTGGRNGYGAKLCNIFSTEFILETADANTGLSYKQTWNNNMSKVSKPKITQLKSKKEFTRVSFKPDLLKFNMDSLDDQILSVLRRRVYDLCGTVKDCNIYLNDKKLSIKNFKSYIEMYVQALKAVAEDPIDPEDTNKTYAPLVHEVISDRWEIGFSVSDGNFNQVSFVNSIATTTGGTHVKYVSDQIISKLTETLAKKEKNKKLMIKAQDIRNNMFLFVNCLIENPAFTSQTKEQLTTRVSQFGGKPSEKFQVTDSLINKILKTSIVDKIRSIVSANHDKALQKADGSRKSRVKNVKLVDANKAGTKQSRNCFLILTEGDSALSLAVSGLAVVGRDYYGCFPLRGKLLNVREATPDQISKNAEINAIKQIMGLQHKKKYTKENIDQLRYGHIIIMTDQDHDGSHIKGLLINFFETSFPGLLEIPGFLLEFITPIVKVTIKGRNNKAEKIPFYTMPEFEEWRETTGKTCRWTQKYYKGLGTSLPEEAREYFAALDKHMKTFHELEGDDRGLIDLAFSKKKADDRKDWLQAFQPGTHLDPNLEIIPISDFINKELILFSMADNVRSIPSVLDGFKPGQRKVLFGVNKRNLKGEIKVAQLAGYVGNHTGYHHGEQSLTQTIIGLAQDFIGSNNLNILKPLGAFGSRAAGGKDFAAPRYLFTQLNEITRKIFNPLDQPLYTYVQDDEQYVEPEWYLPVLPMLLVNGAEGIGTGWSTNVPSFNPTDIVENIKRLMNGEELKELIPWYRGWEGTIEQNGEDKFKVLGRIEQIDNTTLEITEIPVKTWTNNMKEYLISGLGTDKVKPWIKDVEEHHGLNIKFIIKLSSEEMAKSLKMGLMERFRLISTINLSNMVAFDPMGRIKKYDRPNDILRDFYYVRLEYYQKRKDFMTDDLQNQLVKLSEQARFIKAIIDREITVSNKKRSELVDVLLNHKFVRFDRNGKAIKETTERSGLFVDDEELIEEEEQEIGDISQLNASGVNNLAGEEENEHRPESIYSQYDYLLGMAIWSLTRERFERLLKQQEEKQQELTELLKLSAKDLWNSDLDIFLQEWEKFLADDFERRNSIIPNKATKRKGKTTKRKNEDKEEPAKKKPTIKKPAKKPTKETTKETTKGTTKETTKPVEKTQASLKFDKADPEEDMLSFFNKSSSEEAQPPAKSKTKTKPVPKKENKEPVVHSIFSDSDDDLLLGMNDIGKQKPEIVVSDSEEEQPAKPAKGKMSIKDELDDLIETTPQASTSPEGGRRGARARSTNRKPVSYKLDLDSLQGSSSSEAAEEEEDDFEME